MNKSGDLGGNGYIINEKNKKNCFVLL
jgi:hypothetical protein